MTGETIRAWSPRIVLEIIVRWVSTRTTLEVVPWSSPVVHSLDIFRCQSTRTTREIGRWFSAKVTVFFDIFVVSCGWMLILSFTNVLRSFHDVGFSPWPLVCSIYCSLTGTCSASAKIVKSYWSTFQSCSELSDVILKLSKENLLWCLQWLWSYWVWHSIRTLFAWTFWSRRPSSATWPKGPIE